MNKFYVLLPTLLLIIFGVYYVKVAKPEMLAQEAAQQRKVAEQEAADAARRHALEVKAQADARRQQEERDAKERAREEAIKRQKEEETQKVVDETNRLVAEQTNLTKQIDSMQKEITNLRNERENLNRQVFDDAAKVELAKIDRRNAELEIQRMYDMVAQKVDDSFLTQMPPPPTKK